MITEDEAKQKWCPFARQPQVMVVNPPMTDAIVGGCNADSDGGRFARHNCIGSACMTWRWGPKNLEHATTTDEGHPEGGGWKDDGPSLRVIERHARDWSRESKSQPGWCGLAGKDK